MFKAPEDIPALVSLMINGDSHAANTTTVPSELATAAVPAFQLGAELEKVIRGVNRDDLEFWIRSVDLHRSMSVREGEDTEAEQLERLRSLLETFEDLLDTSEAAASK